MDKVLYFNDSNFTEDVINSDQPVLVDFWAEWCGPCHMLAPTVKELARDFDSQIKVGKLDVDNNPTTAAQYGIRSIPTLILFKNGQEITRLSGARAKHEIEQTINHFLGQEAIA